MLDLYELEQFSAFGECGTLSGAAERLHISQPTLTRNMRHIEDAFGVPLFNRTRNHIELNEPGKLAVEYAPEAADGSGAGGGACEGVRPAAADYCCALLRAGAAGRTGSATSRCCRSGEPPETLRVLNS